MSLDLLIYSPGGQRSRKGSAQTADRQTLENTEDEAVKPGQWLTTAPSGERVLTRLDGAPLPVKDVLVCTATDPHTKQVCVCIWFGLV